MAVYTIKVSLAIKAGKNTLVLTPTFCEVDLDENAPSRIVWMLDDGGTDAHFVLRSGRNGFLFDWDDVPGKGVFGSIDADPAGKTISTTDNHFGAGKFGRWRYRLRVKQGPTVYTTPLASGGTKGAGQVDRRDEGNHPVIINR